MNDDSKKKPKATFGDVMLGIPSGRPGERSERSDKPRGRSEGRDRPARSDSREPQQGSAPPQEGQKAAGDEGGQKREGRGGGNRGRGPRREGSDKPERSEKKPQGPLVVVKRATGAIETRPLEANGTALHHVSAHQTEETEGTTTEPTAPTRAARKAAPSTALYDEVPELQSFAEMFEASAKQEGGTGRRQVRVGEKVNGSIFQLGADTAFVSLGGKSEAMIELNELKDEEGILRYGVGDAIEAYVIEAGARGILLSKTLTKGSASMAMLSVGSSRVDLQACKLEYSIVSPK